LNAAKSDATGPVTRDEGARMTLRVHPKLHEEVRIHAIKTGTSVEEFVEGLVCREMKRPDLIIPRPRRRALAAR